MNNEVKAWIIFILVIILLFVLTFFVSNIMTKLALKAVLKTFRKHSALTPDTAKYLNEMGLQQKGLFQFRGLRDYKPAALQFLMKHEIILAAEEGRLYLSEEALTKSGLENKINPGKS
jgi:hypothetical protein